ncbi:19929_t:CDS:2 [Dentiscutata erythropus]|uniref:19929_t:CDS:1 n=1 Tax=Dentiscutata erythropus TaxID=1348616 RepID=A0A9N9A232_9GLOM|nr:19929_t:CDS:2 [Dentiscutata erythropus]
MSLRLSKININVIKYKAKPNPSCPNCNPANLNFALAVQFSRFWPWFQFKYQAQSFSRYTIDLFWTIYQQPFLKDKKNNSNSETFSTVAIIVESTCSSSNSSMTALVAKFTHLTNNTTHNLPTKTITNTIATTTHNLTNIVSISNNINTNTNSNPYDKFFINILSDLNNMFELELELEEEDITEPTYTTIQVGNNFTQLEDQLIANVKIENINNPLQHQPDNIFRLIQLEIKEIKESQEENQKISIPITEDKSTFIGHTLDNQQQQTII